MDAEDREILTFIEGRVPSTEWTPADDETVFAVGELLRAMHDAQAGFVPTANAQWQLPSALPGDEVVCHNDTLGENVVFRGGKPVALIDWEFAAPGRRITDVVAAAAWWAPLRSDHGAKRYGLPTDRRQKRLRLLADGYGLDAPERRELLDAAVRVFEGWHETHRELAEADEDRRSDAHLLLPAIRKNIEWLEEHRSELESWHD